MFKKILQVVIWIPVFFLACLALMAGIHLISYLSWLVAKAFDS